LQHPGAGDAYGGSVLFNAVYGAVRRVVPVQRVVLAEYAVLVDYGVLDERAVLAPDVGL
jgi:hypothetical protein